jgi:hypothetical protein
MPGSEIFKLEIVYKRPWRKDSQLVFRKKDHVRTIPWLFPNMDVVIESFNSVIYISDTWESSYQVSREAQSELV